MSTEILKNVTDTPRWTGDVLNRHETGDFLYKVLARRFRSYHSLPSDGALCVALDGEWGAGKSFFVQRWSDDIARLGHPIVRFDAWVNYLADDPLLGFMAQLEKDLLPYIKKLPIAKRVREGGTKRLKAVFKQAPRAVLPALAILAKGAGKKLLEVDSSELIDAISGAASSVESKKLAGRALESFFESALKSHTDKQAAISGLKASLHSLLAYLDNQQELRLSMFVFVDELDRCRPDYAVRLLEGIKHLFDAQGLCFIFSTNLTQLSAATQAVYGVNFDGYGYLKRFFSAQYSLPEPDRKAFARKLAANSSVLELKLVSSVIDSSATPRARSRMELVASEFAMISEAFRLELRAQEQVMRLAEAANAGIKEGGNVYPLYLFFLCAAYYSGPETFNSVEARSANLTEMLNRLKRVAFKHFSFDENGHGKLSEVTLSDLVAIYRQAELQSIGVLTKQLAEVAPLRYPKSILMHVINETLNNREISADAKTSVGHYYDLVRWAGQLLKREISEPSE